MSPIRPEELAKYPPDWKEVSLRIKERAGWRCECAGECGGRVHLFERLVGEGRCTVRHGDDRGGKRGVTLTTAHLDHDPANCADGNLKAMCEGCHNRYDLPTRVANRRKRLAETLGQEAML